MKALTGTDASLTGKFARFRAHEQVTIITFSDQALDSRSSPSTTRRRMGRT